MGKLIDSKAMIVTVVLACAALCVLGLALHPVVLQEKGLLGCTANLVELGFYGWLVFGSPLARQFGSKASILARRLGWGVGLWLGLDLLGNYLIFRSGAANQIISFIVYGVYLLGLVGISTWTAWSTQNWRAGFSSAFWYVIPAQLTWHLFEFGSFYLLGQTPGGRRFLTEEMSQDMARSGSTNFEAFTMGDFYGAGFLHLLIIGLGMALILGAVSSLGGLVSARLFRAGKPA